MTLISTAYAQQPATAAATGPAPMSANVSSLIMMLMIFVVFYFLLIRPQQKQQRQHKQMIAETKRGDEIITSSGIVGKVTDVDGDFVKVQIADNVNIKLDKNHIQSIKGYETKKVA